jgi:hypothetical protein
MSVEKNKSHMKTKLAILILFLPLGATSLFADETNTNAATSPSTAFVERRLPQIDMDVAFKQYEKLLDELADTESDLALDKVDYGTVSKAEPVQIQKLQAKIDALARLRAETRDEILELADKSDAESAKQ